ALLARRLGDGFDSLELTSGHDVELAQQPLHLRAHQRLRLTRSTLRGTGCGGHNFRQVVEQFAGRLHRRAPHGSFLAYGTPAEKAQCDGITATTPLFDASTGST